MSVSELHASSRIEPGLGRLHSIFHQGKVRFATYRARRAIYRRTRAELAALSNRELADLGIPRCHIHRVALETAAMEMADG